MERFRAASVVALLAVLAGAVPTLGGPGPTHTVDDGALVYVLNFQFVDASTNSPTTAIAVGSEVTWRWLQGAHSTTQGLRGPFADPVGPSLFDSGVIAARDDPVTGEPMTEFTYRFDQPGVFTYYCRPHNGMHGGVVVLPATGPG